MRLGKGVVPVAATEEGFQAIAAMRLMAQEMAEDMPPNVKASLDQLHMGVKVIGREVGIDTDSEEFLLSVTVIAQFIHYMAQEGALPDVVRRVQIVDYMTTSLGLLGGWTYARTSMGDT